jgi:hypothetical protein
MRLEQHADAAGEHKHAKDHDSQNDNAEDDHALDLDHALDGATELGVVG